MMLSFLVRSNKRNAAFDFYEYALGNGFFDLEGRHFAFWLELTLLNEHTSGRKSLETKGCLVASLSIRVMRVMLIYFDILDV